MASSTGTYITTSSSGTRSDDETVKPTLLAFHGSGSNATIHTVQLARLSRHLKEHFDIISCEAPFPSPAGPGILPFFEGCGPYKRWLPPNEKVTLEGMRNLAASGDMPPEVEDLMRDTVSRVRANGSKVVGVIGFSQGTRVATGILRGAEIRRQVVQELDNGKPGELLGQKEKLEKLEDSEWLSDIAFGLCVCPAYPPPLVPLCASALLNTGSTARQEYKCGMPMLFIQGAQDEFEWCGQMLIDGFFELGDGKAQMWRLEMGHHYPVPPEESIRISNWVVAAWEKSEKGQEGQGNVVLGGGAGRSCLQGRL